VRRYLGEHVMLADLVTAGLVSLFIGATFEGFLLASLTMPIFVIYMYLALATFLIDAVHVQQQQMMMAHDPAMTEWEAEQLAAQQQQQQQEYGTGYEPAVPSGHGVDPRF
jgi:hypothetical protein